jgi:osmoprotectant transport system ATP-binding protein
MIELENVFKSFDGGKSFAVDDVSLSVREGELLALLGEAGCGKTTTMKMINRLVDPTEGTIRVAGNTVVSVKDGKRVAGERPEELRRHIGYVIQGSGLFSHMTVARNVAVVPKLLGWPAPRIGARVEELLSLVGLPPAEYQARFPDQLSGGQKQRVALARGLAAGPRVMLLDEPFGALDPVSREEVRQLFRQIRQELKVTAVMVTHDMTEALMLADRIAVMRKGRLLQVGAPHELLASPADDFVKDMLTTPGREVRQLAPELQAQLQALADNPEAETHR